MLSDVGDHILHELNTLYLTSFRLLHFAFLFYPSNLSTHPRKHGKSEGGVSVPEFSLLRA